MTAPDELPREDLPGTAHVCPDCGGVFMNPQQDGGPYHHTCPELAPPSEEAPRKWWQLPRRLGAEERNP